MKSTAILIPARFGSSRFPGKMMTDLGGVPMIRRVFDECRKSGLDTYVLTDHPAIYKAIPNAFPNKKDPSLGVWAVMTDELDASNGTERCSLAVDKIRAFDKYDNFINVQGDMPDITVDHINTIKNMLMVYSVCTLYTDMDEQLQSDPNTVKMITNGMVAHWFGRGFKYGYHHLGIYGYTAPALISYHKMEATEYEKAEQLEQLRWFDKQMTIGVHKVDFNGIEINTPEDAEKWNESTDGRS